MDDERFVPYSELLRAAVPGAQSARPPAPSAAATSAAVESMLLEELPLLRVAALEGFERASARLLREFASELFARELRLAPPEIEALAARFVSELAAFEPLALVLSPADAGRIRAAIPVRVDPALAAGDAIVEVRDGAFESHAAFRLESAVARALSAAA